MNTSNHDFINNTMSRKVIYVYQKNYSEEKGYLKIGDASIDRPDENLTTNSDYLLSMSLKRIREYDNSSDITVLYATVAVDDNWHGFRDYQVHEVLERSGISKVTKGKSTEWFQTDLTNAINAINAVKHGSFTFNNSPVIDEECNGYKPIKFRPEQELAIKQTIDVFKTKDDMLWNAKMRFGKTLSALEVIKRKGFNKSLILTHRPIVDEGWYKDFKKIFHDGYSKYQYGSKKKGEKAKILLAPNYNHKFVYFASMQDLRGSNIVNEEKGFDKNQDVFSVDWDFVIIDEAHEGTTTELAEAVIAELRAPNTKVLKLSGTPFNLLDDYEESQIFTWDYVMEQEAKTTWDEENEGDSNPYSGLPEMQMFTYELHDIIKNNSFVDVENKAFNFAEFFKTNGDNKFIYEKEVWEFLNIISRSEDYSTDKTNMPFSTIEYRSELRHTLWTMPSRKSAVALEKLLNKHPVFSSYNIANLVEDGNSEPDLEIIRNAITDNPEDSFSITLTVRKGTVGTTVEEWTGILVLNNTESASNYLQSIFRVQSPYSGNNGQKNKAYVFDFAPDRTLKMVAEAAKLNTKAGGINSKIQTEQMQKLLNFLPIIGIDGNRMKEYSVKSMLTQLKRAQAVKAVRNGFDDSSIYSDELLRITDGDLKEFEELSKIVGKTKQTKPANNIDVASNGLTDEEWEISEKANHKPKNDRTPEEQEALDKRRKLQKQKQTMISILRGISIRIPLMIYGMDIDIDDDVTIDDFTNLVDDVSWNEFMPEGVTKEEFIKFKKYYDADIFTEAGRRIRRTALAADSLSFEARIDKITSIFSGFKNPDKETVLTPWRVINMHMGEIFGGFNFFDEGYPDKPNELQNTRFINNGKITQYTFDKNSKILEINSKTGLYPLYMAFSIYKNRWIEESPYWTKSEWVFKDNELWQDVLENNIFVLNKTPMARTITYRTLNGYSKNKKVLSNLIVIDELVAKLRQDPKKTIDTIKKQLGDKNMKFDVVVGNPPYMEKRGNYNLQIHFDFLRMSFIASNRYVSLIQPLNWLNDEQTLNMIKGNLHYLYRFPDSTKVFTDVSIPSGVGFGLIDKDSNVNETTVIENGMIEKYEIMGNFGIDDIRLMTELNLDKIPNRIGHRVSDYVGFSNKDKSLKQNEKGDVLIWYKIARGKTGRNNWVRVLRSDIPDGTIIDEYKVMISKDGHAEKSETKPENIFNNKAIVLTPGQITTDRPYLLKAKTKEEAVLLAEYANTKFFRRILHVQDKASSVPKSAFYDVPDITHWVSDYDSNKWDTLDSFLNNYYGLSEETIKDINRRIADK